jgi:serine/threonine protein kinase
MMSGTDPNQALRADAIARQARQVPVEQRSAFIDEACVGDRAFAEAVWAILQEDSLIDRLVHAEVRPCLPSSSVSEGSPNHHPFVPQAQPALDMPVRLSLDEKQRAEEIWCEACELPPDEAERFIDHECGDHPAMRNYVRGHYHEYKARRLQKAAEAEPRARPSLTHKGGQEQNAEREAEENDKPNVAQTQEPYIGFVLNRRYEFIDELGRGGCAAVFKARDLHLDSTVALKTVLPSACSSHQKFMCLKKLLISEGRALRKAPKHANVLVAHDVVRDGPLTYLVCEYVDGDTLSNLIKRHRDSDTHIPVDQALTIVTQLVEALQHIHEHVGFHRDIKPGNIVIDKRGRLQLIDFGLALTRADMLQQQGQIAGTFAYMSPEQLSGHAAQMDGRSDLYGVGVVIYEVLTNQLPVVAETNTPAAWLRAIAQGTVQPPRQLNRDVPEELQRICLKCLHPLPAKRYLSAAEVISALAAVRSPPSSALRPELRAKLTRAAELHGRDEGKAAVELIEEVCHLARSSGLKEEQLEATLNLGFAISARHDLKAVQKKLREAEKLIPHVTSPWHQIQYYRLKARVLLHQKNTPPAEKALRKAIALSSPGNDSIKQVGLLARASYIHLLCETQRAAEATDDVRRIIAALERWNNDDPIALFSELLEACVHWATTTGDSQEVKKLIAMAVSHAGQETAVSLGHALHDCANGARGMKQHEIALACADAAERLGRAAHRPDMAIAAAYTAAAVLGDREDFFAVRERCLQLVDSAQALTEPKLRFAVFHLLSLANRQVGDKTSAVEAAEKALRDSEGDDICVCLAKFALAEALRDCGRIKDGIEHARTALGVSTHAEPPPEWTDEVLTFLGDCSARLGDWATAETYAAELGKRGSHRSADRRKVVQNRIRMHKVIRESLDSVISAPAPLSLARTEGATSVQAANAILMRSVTDAWREYPKAAAAIYDYWGRGNLLRAMLNLRAFSGCLNLTIEVHTVEEARQAVRLWALMADVLILIWKGPTVSSVVLCPVPPTFSKAGGGGYLCSLIAGSPPVPAEVTGVDLWKTIGARDATTRVIWTPHASLLPPEVGDFLCKEAGPLISLGRLIVVPATGIGCVGSGHGPLENLFAEACNAIPAIKGDAARFPASWLPYFPDIPLDALAHIVQEYDDALRRLRLLLIRRARRFQSSTVTGFEAKELELEIQDSIAQITATQATLRHKHGWGEALEAVASRCDGFNENDLAPILVLQNMGYRWRVESSNDGLASDPDPTVLPKDDEPVCTWLHPPDATPKFITNTDIHDCFRSRGKRIPRWAR